MRLRSLIPSRGSGQRELAAAPETAPADGSIAGVMRSRELAVANGHGTLVDPGRGATAGGDGVGSWYLDAMMGGPDVAPELTGRAKFEVYREMAMTDAACRSLLWAYELPIRQADWGVKPAERDPDGEPAAKARADWGSQLMGLEGHAPLMTQTWDEWLVQTLTFFRDGSFGEEIVWGDETEWVDADGDRHLLRPPVRMAPRYASTVWEYDRDKKTGRITRLLQDLPRASWIQGENLAWYVSEKEGESIFGRSILRAAYGPWKLKRALIVAAAIAWDRYASKLPVVRHPAGPQWKKQAETLGANIRTHERAYATLEGPPPEYGGEWDLKLEGPDQIASPVELLRYYDGQIAASGLQQFTGLATSTHGSRAVGEVLSDPFYMAVTAFAGYVASERQRQFLRRVWDVNFGADVPTPTITVQKIQGRNVQVLSRAISDLSAAGLSFTDRDTQNDVRDQLDLRHLPEPAASAVAALPDDVGVAIAEGDPIIPVADAVAAAAGA